MIERVINSIDELLEFVRELNEKHNQLLWYRGVANSAWALIPSIQRSEQRIHAERFITNDFYIKAKGSSLNQVGSQRRRGCAKL